MKINTNIGDLGELVRLIILICGVSASLILVMYVVSKGWESPAAWGAFGDFVGGLLNPLFAFANVIILVVISYQLANMEETRAEKELAAQKQIALYSLKHENFQKLSDLLDKVHLALLTDTKTDADKLLLVKMEVSAFFSMHLYLFPALASFDHRAFDQAIGKIMTAARPFGKDPEGNTDQERADYMAQKKRELIDSTVDFSEQRVALIRIIFESMMADHFPES